MSDKESTYRRVLNAAVTLDLRAGHLRWTIAQLARNSRVSRALIYHYFGRAKIDILKEAVKLIGGELAGSTPARMQLWQEGRAAETFLATRRMFAEVPALVSFYFLNRSADTIIGKSVREQERAFHAKVGSFFPHLNASEIEGVAALLFGVGFYSNLSEAGARRGLEILFSAIEAMR